MSPSRLTSHRNGQPSGLYRLCTGTAESQPTRTLDPCAGQVTSVHNPGQVHWSIRTSHDSKVWLKQVACPRCSGTATIRGHEQTATAAATTGRRATATSASSPACCVCEHADEPVCRCTKPAGSAKPLQHVRPEPPGRSSTISCTDSTIRSADEYDAATTATAIQPAPEPVCPSYYPRWAAASNDDGSTAVGTIRYPPCPSEGHEPPRSQRACSSATITGILPTAT